MQGCAGEESDGGISAALLPIRIGNLHRVRWPATLGVNVTVVVVVGVGVVAIVLEFLERRLSTSTGV